MIQYVLESIGFQLLFLVIYDVFLKRETFFQWNRLYLIATFILAIILPWIKIEALKTTVSKPFGGYSEFLWNLNDMGVPVVAQKQNFFAISWELNILFGGMAIAALIFAYKLFQIYQLREKGQVRYLTHYTRIIIKNSEVAFSFFKAIFLGDKVMSQEHESIIQHELVHIRQGHSYDLIFFEIMRIVSWFNPLVYVYQNRISELHEFIADAQVAKTHKKEQYQLLLTQVFQTQHISFINPFFKTSLIKKRIVMLQKAKSKSVFQLKYLVLVPLLIGILIYTSCESEIKSENLAATAYKTGTETVLELGDLDHLSEEETQQKKEFFEVAMNSKVAQTYILKDQKGQSITVITNEKGPVSVDINKDQDDKEVLSVTESRTIESNELAVPFAVVDEAPIFPGCEDAENKRDCFQQSMYKHISKNFRYPVEAQEQGIQGKVNIVFLIDTDGAIINTKMRGPSELLENEASRIISKLPKMTPGKQKGKAVLVPFSIPITFKLQGPKLNSEQAISKKMVAEMFVKAYKKNQSGKTLLVGKVSDGTIGLPGVNVVLKGSANGVVTDFDGAFAIEVKEGQMITFQYGGIKTAALRITDKEDYSIKTNKQ